MNYYPFHLGDYAAHTAHLEPMEDLAYRRMLDLYYRTERPLPLDTAEIARLIRLRDHAETVRDILREFFTETEEGFRHERCDEELSRFADRSAKAKASAAASVIARSKVKSGARSERLIAAREKGRHTDAEWNALREFCGLKCVRCGADGHQDRDHIKPIYQGGSDGIDNIQPLCAKCNSSKGPEDVDHRPSGWRSFVERSLSVRSANHNQEPEPKPKEETKTARKRAAPAALVSVQDLVSEGIDAQCAADWLAVRKSKHLPLTATAWDDTKAEAVKAGMSAADAVQMAARQSWAGFKASWVGREDAPRHSQPVTVPMGANPADAFNAAMNERAATATRPPAAILAIAGRVGR